MLVSSFKSLIASRFQSQPLYLRAPPQGLCFCSPVLASSSPPPRQCIHEVSKLLFCLEQLLPTPSASSSFNAQPGELGAFRTVLHPATESLNLCLYAWHASYISVTAEITQHCNYIHATYIEHIYCNYNDLSVFFTRFERNISFFFILLTWIWCLERGSI